MKVYVVSQYKHWDHTNSTDDDIRLITLRKILALDYGQHLADQMEGEIVRVREYEAEDGEHEQLRFWTSMINDPQVEGCSIVHNTYVHEYDLDSDLWFDEGLEKIKNFLENREHK